LLIEKVNMKNKKVSEKWKSEIDFHGVAPELEKALIRITSHPMVIDT
jgi:hypothetical protein